MEHTSDVHRRDLRRNAIMVAIAAALILTVLFAISRVNYLLFHTLVESFSILVAFSIFVISWNTRRFAATGYLVNLGIASLFTGLVLLIHALAYRGMNVFSTDADLPTQLWVLSRFLLAGGFVVAGISLAHFMRPRYVFLGFAVVTAAFVSAFIFWPGFPHMYVEGQGLTPLKIALEYVVMAVYGVGLWLLMRTPGRFDPTIRSLLGAAILVMIGAELAFTLYIDVYGILNFMGHALAFIGMTLVYLAIIDTSLNRPYAIIFRELSEREEAEREIAETLQAAILSAPETVESIEFGQAYVSATATALVGGDFVDLFSVAPGRVAFVLGDVCGKGIGVAATTTLVRATLRGFAYHDPDPTEVLVHTNEALAHQLANDKFATVVYGVIDSETGEATIACAGHPSPVLRHEGDARIVPLPSNPPLGVVTGHVFESTRLTLQACDELVLYSDGLIEARRDGETFGEERAREHIAASDAEPGALAQALLGAAIEYAAGSLADDVAIAVVRFVGNQACE